MGTRGQMPSTAGSIPGHSTKRGTMIEYCEWCKGYYDPDVEGCNCGCKSETKGGVARWVEKILKHNNAEFVGFWEPLGEKDGVAQFKISNKVFERFKTLMVGVNLEAYPLLISSLFTVMAVKRPSGEASKDVGDASVPKNMKAKLSLAETLALRLTYWMTFSKLLQARDIFRNAREKGSSDEHLVKMALEVHAADVEHRKAYREMEECGVSPTLFKKCYRCRFDTCSITILGQKNP